MSESGANCRAAGGVDTNCCLDLKFNERSNQINNQIGRAKSSAPLQQRVHQAALPAERFCACSSDCDSDRAHHTDAMTRRRVGADICTRQVGVGLSRGATAAAAVPACPLPLRVSETALPLIGGNRAARSTAHGDVAAAPALAGSSAISLSTAADTERVSFCPAARGRRTKKRAKVGNALEISGPSEEQKELVRKQCQSLRCQVVVDTKTTRCSSWPQTASSASAVELRGGETVVVAAAAVVEGADFSPRSSERARGASVWPGALVYEREIRLAASLAAISLPEAIEFGCEGDKFTSTGESRRCFYIDDAKSKQPRQLIRKLSDHRGKSGSGGRPKNKLSCNQSASCGAAAAAVADQLRLAAYATAGRNLNPTASQQPTVSLGLDSLRRQQKRKGRRGRQQLRKSSFSSSSALLLASESLSSSGCVPPATGTGIYHNSTSETIRRTSSLNDGDNSRQQEVDKVCCDAHTTARTVLIVTNMAGTGGGQNHRSLVEDKIRLQLRMVEGEEETQRRHKLTDINSNNMPSVQQIKRNQFGRRVRTDDHRRCSMGLSGELNWDGGGGGGAASPRSKLPNATAAVEQPAASRSISSGSSSLVVCASAGGASTPPSMHAASDQKQHSTIQLATASASQKPALKKRENWGNNIEFLLAVIGFAVDLGNVWRFPYICYKNGGGAFLIPYTVMFILGGLPIFYLEMSLGQYFSSGCLTVWRRVCPMAKGIGYAMCVLNFFTGLYYNTIISWAVFFFVESFTYGPLPWTSCNNAWNSGNCKTIEQRQESRAAANGSSSMYAMLPDNDPGRGSYSTDANQTFQNFSSPTRDYFEREVLRIHLSTGIDDLGSLRYPLAAYLAIVFVCIYFAIWKGVKSTGKAVWITALLPYFVLFPLLFRGVFLEGAMLGIKYYLYPTWMKILNVDVWVAAAEQVYFSLGPGFGTLMALSSYNKFNHNCRKDALIAASINYFASFISGLVIFAVLGYMATIQNVGIERVATEGPGLVFQVYPEGLATMSFSAVWSVLFFIMVITLGIDSTFGGLESVITGLCDEYPRTLRAHRGIFIFILIVVIYCCSLPTTTYGGNYVIFLLESYGTTLSLLFIVLIETIIVCWLYGADKFCNNLQEMYGERPGPYWRICWKYISPTILLLIFIAACSRELDKYQTLQTENYSYPSWAPRLGLLMTGSSVCCVPIYAIYYLKTKTLGTILERLKSGCTPIENDDRDGNDRYADAVTDIIRDHDNIHLDTDI